MTLNAVNLPDNDIRWLRKMRTILPKKPPDHQLFLEYLAAPVVTVKTREVDDALMRQWIKATGSECAADEFAAMLSKYSKKLERGVTMPTNLGAMYLAAHRSMDWLGLERLHSPLWVYAFSRGRLNPWWPYPSSTGREYAQLCPPLDEFEARVGDTPGEGRELSDTELDQMLFCNEDGKFHNKYEPFDKGKEHPLQRLLGRAKFKGLARWSTQQVTKIDQDVTACLQGRIGVEQLLAEEILRGFALSADPQRFLQFFSRRANQVYRRVYERFRRRGSHMPSPPKGWRGRVKREVRMAPDGGAQRYVPRAHEGLHVKRN